MIVLKISSCKFRFISFVLDIFSNIPCFKIQLFLYFVFHHQQGVKVQALVRPRADTPPRPPYGAACIVVSLFFFENYPVFFGKHTTSPCKSMIWDSEISWSIEVLIHKSNHVFQWVNVCFIVDIESKIVRPNLRFLLSLEKSFHSRAIPANETQCHSVPQWLSCASILF